MPDWIEGRTPFNWRQPDYGAVIRDRAGFLSRIREDPSCLPALKAFYKENPAQFIDDWGVTYDPRNVERHLPAMIPFRLFDRQREWIDYLMRKWRAQEPGISEKSRDMGLSWLAMGTACTLCLFFGGMAIGFGSRKEEYVDKLGSPKALFPKARMFMMHLPVEFRGGWDPQVDAPHMRLNFPQSGSYIGGEAGDNIGRGDRTGIYFIDESAYLDRPELIEASLSQTTNCRQDISSANGMGNVFAQRRFSGKVEVFTFHWTQDPRKDAAWYAKMKNTLDAVVLAQEVDIDYTASAEGILIPAAWVRAAYDAHEKLGIVPSGARGVSLDVADEGKDLNAACASYGVLVEHIEEWSGKGDDIFGTTERAFGICDAHGAEILDYDADGLGAGVRGDARILNQRRPAHKQVTAVAFRGSEGVWDPDRLVDPKGPPDGRRNKDFFANRKAQGWWALRMRFLETYRAVVDSMPYDPDQIISLGRFPNRDKLASELSQPTYSVGPIGKLFVDKAPEGTRSPNMADSVMIRYSSLRRKAMVITAEAVAASRQGVRRRV